MKLICPVLVFLLITLAFAEEEQEACGGKPADVVFLLDSSASIGIENFRKQIQFTEDVVAMFDIGPEKTRVGVVLFSTRVYPIFSLPTYSDRSSLEDAIQDIGYMAGGTHTDAALHYVREKEFKPYARTNIPRIIILLTDGQSYDTKKTQAEAQLSHEAGLTTFAIGIGGGVDNRELSALASDPDSSYLFHISNYSALQNIKRTLAIKTCKVKYVPPTPSPQADRPVDASDCITNLIIGIDTNGVSTRYKRTILAFLSNVIDGVSQSPSQLRTSQIMSQCMDSSGSYSSKSYAALLKSMRAQNPKKSRKVSAVGLLVINSDVADVSKTMSEARRAKFKGLDLIVLNIGKDASDKTLGKILGVRPNSKEFSQRVIHVQSYRKLSKQLENVVHTLTELGQC